MATTIYAVVYYNDGGRSPSLLIHGAWATQGAAERAQATLLGASARRHEGAAGWNRSDNGKVSKIDKIPMNTIVDWNIAQPPP
jgi:hypothetical protein